MLDSKHTKGKSSAAEEDTETWGEHSAKQGITIIM